MDEAKLAEHRARVTFWDLVQAYRDETGASEAWIMRRAGLNKGAFSAWRARGIPRLPDHDHLVALSEVLRVDYETLLDTILRDTNYLPEWVAREQAEFAATYREKFWEDVRDLAQRAREETGGDRRALQRWFMTGPARGAPVMVGTKARAVALGNIPDDAPNWLSEAFDTSDLQAVANTGPLEEPGE